MSRIGLIAGKGNLPLIWAKAAREKGVEVYAYQLVEVVDQPLEEYVSRAKKISVGKLDELIKTISKDKITKVVMIGKVEKSLLYQGINLDNRFKKLLADLEDLNSDSILLAIVNELINEGIEVAEQFIHLDKLLPKSGTLTSKKIDEKLMQDIKYGFKMAREIARLDIGQTLVVKNKAVLSVEAIEGTDATIQRGGRITGPGAVVAKVSKPQQDFRFDLPTVGDTTLNNLIDVKAKALVVEAELTLIIDRENFLKKAEENAIDVIALKTADLD